MTLETLEHFALIISVLGFLVSIHTTNFWKKKAIESEKQLLVYDRLRKNSISKLSLGTPQLWKNKKKGEDYTLIAVGIDCTNERDGTSVVIYSAIGKPICVRELNEFNEKFEFIRGPIDTFLEDIEE